MDIQGWDARYRRSGDLDAEPTPLLVETANHLSPGRALDLACGTGRNALWLAARGWRVTAVDGAATAVEILKQRAAKAGLVVETHVADLQNAAYRIEPGAFELIAICYYLQRDLFAPAKAGATPGGTLIAIVHITEGDEGPTATRLRPGELSRYFRDWEVLHNYEGKPTDPAHQRLVAEIVARRPVA